MVKTGINPERRKISKEKIDSCRENVVKLARLGCTREEVAEFFLITEDTLKRHLQKEFDEGRNTLRRSLRKAQLEAAINDKNTAMLIWMGKCYLGQREPRYEVEHTGGITVEMVNYAKKRPKKDK